MSSPLYDLMAHAARKPSTADDNFDPAIAETFFSSQVFVTTNVTQYYYAGTDQEFWHIDRHFPNLAPLFDSFWIETKRPTHVRSAEYGMKDWHHGDSELYQRPERWAAWFINLDTTEDLRTISPKIADLYDGIDLTKCWLYAVSLFTLGKEDTPSTFHIKWTFTMAIDKETGLAIRNTNEKHRHSKFDPFFFASFPQGKFRDEVVHLLHGANGKTIPLADKRTGSLEQVNLFDVIEMEMIALLKPLLLALSFAHCRNVERVTQHAPVKLNKKRVSRGLPPFNRHYTLTIEPMRRIIQHELDLARGRHTNSDIGMAMHRVRGHFKTYTPDKPLMGHAVGTWFWSDNIRGSEKRGTVKKTYAVNVPHGR